MYGINGSSDAISRDMNSLLHSSTFKHPAHGEFAKIKHLISLDTYPNYSYQNQDHSQHQQNESYGQNNSSFFSNLLSESGDNELQDPNTERLFMKRKEEDKFELNVRKAYAVMKQEQEQDVKNVGYGYMNQNLVRQNSTPPGFLSTENGSSSTPSRFMSQINENKNELHDTKFSNMKRSRDGVLKMPQNEETGNHTPNLVHHLSLPKTSSEMAVVDNFLQFQQESTVPWRTRAKRGFATHPRSIAERVRRTRISERIKRLQELFPDIDKHSNTADMLDMAVEYIKNLQKELQTLNDARARCKCSSKQLEAM